MIYYLYKITNLINQKIYIGVHKTKNIDDSYMGSGKTIIKSIRKYGIKNFKKDIIELFDTEELMYAQEAEIVNANFIKREDVYNICIGGNGGWSLARQYLNSDVYKGISDKFLSREWQDEHFTDARRNALRDNIIHINDCMTDFDLNPIAFVPCQRLNTLFFAQPKMAEIEVKKHQVIYKVDGEGDWKITGCRYTSIAEFSRQFPILTPCKLLEE